MEWFAVVGPGDPEAHPPWSTWDLEGGFNAAMGRQNDALCVPRGTCEELCEQLPGCTSFDMHRRYARCYLNFGECTELVVNASEYDLVVKSETGGTAEGYVFGSRDTYRTVTAHPG